MQYLILTRQHLMLTIDYKRYVKHVRITFASGIHAYIGQLTQDTLASNHEWRAGVNDAVHVLDDDLVAQQHLVHLDHPVVLVYHVMECKFSISLGWVILADHHVRTFVYVG